MFFQSQIYWENKRLSDIKKAHSDIFWLLSKFFNEDRLNFIFGNHDIVKSNDKFVKNNLYKYFDEHKKKYIPLFDNIRLHEGIVLRLKLLTYPSLILKIQISNVIFSFLLNCIKIFSYSSHKKTEILIQWEPSKWYNNFKDEIQCIFYEICRKEV